MTTHKMILQSGSFSLRTLDKDGQTRKITLKAGDAVELTLAQCKAFVDKFRAAEEVAAEAEVKAKMAAQKSLGSEPEKVEEPEKAKEPEKAGKTG